MGGEAYEIKKNPLESRNQKGREREREKRLAWDTEDTMMFFPCMRLDFFLKAETR